MHQKNNILIGYYSIIIAILSAALITSNKIICLQGYLLNHALLTVITVLFLFSISKIVFGLEATIYAIKYTVLCIIINIALIYIMLATPTPSDKMAEIYYHSYINIYRQSSVYYILALIISCAALFSYCCIKGCDTSISFLKAAGLCLIIDSVVYYSNLKTILFTRNIIGVIGVFILTGFLYSGDRYYYKKSYNTYNTSTSKSGLDDFGDELPKYLLFMSLMSVMLLINSHSICYKLIDLGYLGTVAASGVVFPLTFLLSDVVAEHYGYTASRTLIWSTLMAQFIFVSLVYLVYQLPHDLNWQNQEYFKILFSNLFPRQIVAASICVFFSFFIFSFLIAVIKTNLQNKKFLKRTLIANMVANAVLCFLSYTILYYNKYNMWFIAKIILDTWVIKMIIATLGTFIITVPMIYYLKLYDHRSYGYNKHYNPIDININVNTK